MGGSIKAAPLGCGYLLEKAVEIFRSMTGDNKILCLRFDNQLESDGIAAGWHPTEATNKKATQKLIEIINYPTTSSGM